MTDDNNVVNTGNAQIANEDEVENRPENVPSDRNFEESIADNFRQAGNINPNMPPLQLVTDEAGNPLPLRHTTFGETINVPEADFNPENSLHHATLPDTTNTSETNLANLVRSAAEADTSILNVVNMKTEIRIEEQTSKTSKNSNGAARQSKTQSGAAPQSDPGQILTGLFEQIREKIVQQNFEITELKDQLEEEESRFPQTVEVRNEINTLRKAIDEGIEKLNTYYKEIRHVQEKDPQRDWPALTFATSWDEDNDSSTFDYQVISSRIEPLTIPPGKAEKDGFVLDFSGSSSELSLYRPRRGRHSGYRSNGRTSGTSEQECERNRLQEELANRDKVVERLHKKVLRMQGELARLCKERQNRFDSNSVNDDCTDYCQNTGVADDDDCEAFELINERFEKLKKNLLKNGNGDASDNFSTRGRVLSSDDKGIQKKYCELLEEYTKKDSQLKQMQARVDAFAQGTEPLSSDTMIDILRKQLRESREEHEAQKVIICEQAQQIEDYHEKYLVSLQKTEEMKCIAKRLQMDNRKVEDQINLEIKKIKDKFENKLAEYAQYPNMLENEQIKLSQCASAKNEIEKKLRMVCLEYKKLKDQTGTGNNVEKIVACKNCAKLQEELDKSNNQVDVIRQCYNEMTKRHDSVKMELDTMRLETAKVITRLKERSEDQRQKLSGHIHKLENNLAKARAAVSICCADKETTIKDMQGQLNCLSLCLDTSQKQIKTLKDHIAYLNNGKSKSVVICCQADE